MRSKIASYQSRADRLAGQKKAMTANISSLNRSIIDCENEKVLMNECLSLLSKAASVSRAEIKQRIENIVSFSLQQVLERDDYRFELEFERKRGQIEVSPVLNTKTSKGHPLDSHGGGVVDVISTVLRLAIKHKLRVSGPMILDEPAKWLGGTHRPYFMAMLREFCERAETQMILCSHIDEYIREAETAIRVELHEGISTVSDIS